ncbi:MAG: C40 family peptidase [Candidatus Brennerbacteria bacterium]|nr:C40 family peptidase [Candidatus Brennerbacteria bacterium]
MELTKDQAKEVIETALSYVGHPYDSKEFNCVGFVRTVYRTIGIKISPLKSCAPPAELNLSAEQAKDLPVGHLMFLKDRDDPRKERSWTHVVIILTKETCIHCSLFFGRKVTISSFAEMYCKYDVVI